jgi:hypothetical protein
LKAKKSNKLFGLKTVELKKILKTKDDQDVFPAKFMTGITHFPN